MSRRPWDEALKDSANLLRELKKSFEHNQERWRVPAVNRTLIRLLENQVFILKALSAQGRLEGVTDVDPEEDDGPPLSQVRKEGRETAREARSPETQAMPRFDSGPMAPHSKEREAKEPREGRDLPLKESRESAKESRDSGKEGRDSGKDSLKDTREMPKEPRETHKEKEPREGQKDKESRLAEMLEGKPSARLKAESPNADDAPLSKTVDNGKGEKFERKPRPQRLRHLDEIPDDEVGACVAAMSIADMNQWIEKDKSPFRIAGSRVFMNPAAFAPPAFDTIESHIKAMGFRKRVGVLYLADMAAAVIVYSR